MAEEDASSHASSGSDGSFGDWKSDAEEKEPCVCLLCDTVAIPRLILAHLAADHGFDVLGLLRAKSGDDYAGIRFVNYVRCSVAGGGDQDSILAALSDPDAPLWRDEALLLPFLAGDPLLYSLGPAGDWGSDGEEGEGEEEEKGEDSGADGLAVVGVSMRPQPPSA